MSDEQVQIEPKVARLIATDLFDIIKKCDNNSFLQTKDDIERRKYELVFLRDHKFDNEADVKSVVYHAIRDVYNDWKDFKKSIERYAEGLDNL